MREDAPCRFCTDDKHTACHDHCEKFKEWKERDKAQKDYTQAHRYRLNVPMSHAREKITNHYLKYPLRKQGGSQ